MNATTQSHDGPNPGRTIEHSCADFMALPSELGTFNVPGHVIASEPQTSKRYDSKRVNATAGMIETQLHNPTHMRRFCGNYHYKGNQKLLGHIFVTNSYK